MTSTGTTSYTVPANGETMSFGADMTFLIPAPNVEYEVQLDFMEPNITAAKQRLFDVIANDELKYASLDIFAHVGLQKRLTRKFKVVVADGVLRIEFKSLPGSRPAVVSNIVAVPTGM